MSQTVTGDRPVRKVGVLLGIGIFLLPIVFVWFLLRAGHSTLSRVVGFGWLALTLLIAAAQVGSEPQGAPESVPEVHDPAAPPQPPTLRIGSEIPIGPLTVTVTGVSSADHVGSEFMSERASEGGTLVIVEYSVRNHSDKPVTAALMPKLGLIDPAGVAYKADAGKTAAYQVTADADEKGWSDLNPGITTRSGEVFEVSKAAYDPATWNVTVDGKRNRVAIQ